MARTPGEEEKRENARFTRKAGPAISLGTNLAAGVGLLTFLGYYIDGRRGGGIFWTICGLALGLIYGAYETWKVVKALSSGNDDDNIQADNNPGKK